MQKVSPSNKDEIYEAVVEAVYAVVNGTDLHVETVPDIRAIEVTGDRVDAYVLVPSIGGFRVELWQHHGYAHSPFRTMHTEDHLDEAVGVAVHGALSGTWYS